MGIGGTRRGGLRSAAVAVLAATALGISTPAAAAPTEFDVPVSPVGVDTAKWGRSYAEVSQIGLVPPGLDPNAWVDTSFAPAASG